MFALFHPWNRWDQQTCWHGVTWHGVLHWLLKITVKSHDSGVKQYKKWINNPERSMSVKCDYFFYSGRNVCINTQQVTNKWPFSWGSGLFYWLSFCFACFDLFSNRMKDEAILLYITAFTVGFAQLDYNPDLEETFANKLIMKEITANIFWNMTDWLKGIHRRQVFVTL